MASIYDILGWRAISTSVQKVETGIPDRLPPAFSTLTERVLGDQTTYVTFRGQRQTARRAEYGAQSRARTLLPVGEQSVRLLHFAEHEKFRQELFLRLRQANDLMAQTKAQEEIARHGADFRQLFDNTRIASKTLMLSKGMIYFDAGGNILTTSAGAAVVVDYGVPSSNRGQLGGIIDGSWANPATNVIQQIENIKVANRRATGRVPAHAFYGKNIAAYLLMNTTLKSYWNYNQDMLKQFNSAPATIPNGFAGLQWHPMGDTFYDDAAGTVQPLWDDDQVTLTPEITRNVYTLYEGSIPVPKSFGIYTSAEAAWNDIELVYGMGGYAVLEVDPVGAKEVYFDTYFPQWKNPNDLYLIDTTP